MEAAADHCRRRRERSFGRLGGEPPPRRAQSRRRQGPGFGDRRKAMLGDIAVMTGATFFSEDLGRNLEEVELKELGTAKKVVVNKDSTVIVEGAGKEIRRESTRGPN